LRLRTAGLPDPDLVILVGPAPLMPDFLLFQSAYAEFHIPAAGWADFAPRDLDRALADFSRRDRRFGRV
jgi:undecaprenyl diphosphate synthase